MVGGSVVCSACTLLTPLGDYSAGDGPDVATTPEDVRSDSPADVSSIVDSGNDLAARVDAGDAEGGCPCTFFGQAFSGNPSDPDKVAAEVGIRFTSDIDAKVVGIRFYRGIENIGPHTANLWSASGERLATGLFTDETESGWQTMRFATPVPITANTTYVASYRTESGHYASTGSFFFVPFDVPPLHADTTNGVFTYEAGAMPTQTYQNTNYWVDVIIE